MRLLCILFAAGLAMLANCSIAPAQPMQIGGPNASFDLSRTAFGGKVEVTEDRIGQHHGTYNLTGPNIGATFEYLFQHNRVVFGLWTRVSGGLVEAMPYLPAYGTVVIRRNMTGLVGLKGGAVFGNWVPFVRIGGGGAWASASSSVLGTTNTAISVLYAGAGVDYYITPRVFVGAEAGFSRLGDFPAGPLYFTPRDDVSGFLRLGVRF